MPTFAAIIYERPDVRSDPSSPEGQEYMGGYFKFGELAGQAITGGAGLLGPETATTIHVVGGEDGEVVHADGPYAETKEFLGGFYLIDAEDLDAAIALARHIPAAWRDGGKVEIRPVIPM